jgi:DNA-binding LytR/AlgR family response regulator
MQVMNEAKVDLLFLDIQMPGLTGLEFSKSLQSDVRVIFTTAFSQFALEGFKVDALDYLVKPFNYSEFLRSAQKAHKWFSMVNAPEKELSGRSAESIMVKSESRLVGIELDDILFVESMGDYVKIYCIDKEQPVITQTTMKSMVEKLPDHQFFRVHRSYLVNMDRVNTIERNRILFDKMYIPISESVKEDFNKMLKDRFLM